MSNQYSLAPLTPVQRSAVKEYVENYGDEHPNISKAIFRAALKNESLTLAARRKLIILIAQKQRDTAPPIKERQINPNIEMPYGWIRHADGHAVPHVAERFILEQALRMRHEGCTMVKIAERLNKRELFSRNGHHWTASTISKMISRTAPPPNGAKDYD